MLRERLTLSTLAILVMGLASAEMRADYPYVPVPFREVRVEGGFWGPRFETNRRTTVWYDFGKCEETRRIDNFAKAGKLMAGPFRGIPFDDSDVFKVIEGASYSLAIQPDAKLDNYLDELIAKVTAAQETDGYLYTARTIDPKPHADFHGPERWSNLAVSHELYNVGHLFEAAVAHFEATGKRTLLDVAVKNADLLAKVFGPSPGQRRDPPGHQEVELGLARLYRATGRDEYLKLARFFLDQRGRPEGHKLRGAYQQDHAPVIEQKEAVGHAVRAAYMYSGMADVAALTGDQGYVAAIDRIWDNVTSQKLYLTGGIGARHDGEAFGDGYELPNAEAYNETCAAIANALWNQRMFQLHGDARYVDLLERVIYNGFLSGVSLSGDRFFYPNPLACNGKTKFNHGEMGRSPWFGVSCCPVNVVRFIPSIAGYVYAHRNDTAYVNLFVNGEGTVRLAKNSVRIRQETEYPWSGKILMRVDPKEAGPFTLAVRIPGWTGSAPLPGGLYRYVDDPSAGRQLVVNGTGQWPRIEKGYALISRTWKPGDTVELNLRMPIRRVVTDEHVAANRGRVALERGPIVYCAEAVDNNGRISNLVLPDDAPLQAEVRPDLLGGITVLTGQVRALSRGKDGAVATEDAAFTAIPYYAWAHRKVGEMAVWLPRTESAVVVPPPPTLASSATPSASHVWAADTVEALNDQVEPRDSIDHSIPRFTWWDHRGTAEWVQYDFAAPTRVSGVEVYWFDDTGRGQCRVPQSWRLLYRVDDRWEPVANPSAAEVRKDRFNQQTFKPVETRALRLEVKLQPDVSGGILEWKLK
jgi:DUF1680 family protein